MHTNVLYKQKKHNPRTVLDLLIIDTEVDEYMYSIVPNNVPGPIQHIHFTVVSMVRILPLFVSNAQLMIVVDI
jgi:hypothetical protein